MIGRHLTGFGNACRRHGIIPTRYVFAVNISKQIALLCEKPQPSLPPRCDIVERLQVDRHPCHGKPALDHRYRLLKTFRCSTSKFGIGEKAGSNMTPRGLHRITEKIGGGWPVGTAFKSRQVIGYTWQGLPNALITTRILWLDGLEPGFNRGGDVDSHGRYIYIHGTGDESSLGRPASHGCIQLAADDLIPLYEKLPVGTLVWIAEN